MDIHIYETSVLWRQTVVHMNDRSPMLFLTGAQWLPRWTLWLSSSSSATDVLIWKWCPWWVPMVWVAFLPCVPSCHRGLGSTGLPLTLTDSLIFCMKALARCKHNDVGTTGILQMFRRPRCVLTRRQSSLDGPSCEEASISLLQATPLDCVLVFLPCSLWISTLHTLL